MSESNGKSSEHPPDISPEVQRLLKQNERRKEIDARIEVCLRFAIGELMNELPDCSDRIATALEGAAAKIRSEYEAKKRKARNDGNRSGR